MIAEELVLLCAIGIVFSMVGESVGKQHLPIALYNSPISLQIKDLGEDLDKQIIEKISGEDFGLQLDKVANCTLGLVMKKTKLWEMCFVRYYGRY